jgi:ubiquinone biosynthesis protein UbiJ
VITDPRDIILKALEAAINRLLRLDPDSVQRLSSVQGKLVELRLRAPELRAYCEADSTGVRLSREAAHTPDAVISGTFFALSRSAFAVRSGTAPVAGDVAISGDAEAASALRDLLRKLDIDWEEQLSRVVGDVIAHQIGNAGRDLQQWLMQARQALERNLSEYLREEARILASRGAVESFEAAVDTLRTDADRLEKRLERLQAHLQTGGSVSEIDRSH